MPETEEPCGSCSGAGEVACGSCTAGQVAVVKTVKDRQTGQNMRVTEYRSCSKCSGGYVKCSGCGGSGKKR